MASENVRPVVFVIRAIHMSMWCPEACSSHSLYRWRRGWEEPRDGIPHVIRGRRRKNEQSRKRPPSDNTIIIDLDNHRNSPLPMHRIPRFRQKSLLSVPQKKIIDIGRTLAPPVFVRRAAVSALPSSPRRACSSSTLKPSASQPNLLLLAKQDVSVPPFPSRCARTARRTGRAQKNGRADFLRVASPPSHFPTRKIPGFSTQCDPFH